MTYRRTILAICFGAAVLTIGITAGCKKQPQQAQPNDSNQAAQQQPAESNTTAKPPVSPATASPKPTLNEIIRLATTWDTAYTRWYGKESPDFTVTDIKGQKHTLSAYKGKNVMLVFWATWCPPCISEIPSIIKLRKQIGEDKLVILGISYIDPRNTPEAVDYFIKSNPVINYPVTATNQMTMPSPYKLIRVLPSSFFIAPDGKIKLATEGLIPLAQMQAIIEAER